MEYLIKHKFKQVDDPYHNGRTCFEVNGADKVILAHLVNDPKFLYLGNNIAYFEK